MHRQYDAVVDSVRDAIGASTSLALPSSAKRIAVRFATAEPDLRPTHRIVMDGIGSPPRLQRSNR